MWLTLCVLYGKQRAEMSTPLVGPLQGINTQTTTLPVYIPVMVDFKVTHEPASLTDAERERGEIDAESMRRKTSRNCAFCSTRALRRPSLPS
jgi:hypothetical protein